MRTLVLIVMLLTISSASFSQYQIIFTDPEARDLGELVSFGNIHNDNSAVYIYIAGNWFTFRSPYWVRYYKNESRYDSLPHYGYLRGGFCISTWGWGTTGIGTFAVSNTDTNLVLGLYAEGPCGSPEGGSYNLISYNSGQNISNPLQTQNGVMRSFDIDPFNDSLIYGAGSNVYEPLKFWKSTNKGHTWSSLTLGGNTYFVSVKVNPISANEIYYITRDTIYKSSDFGNSFNSISENPGGDRRSYIDSVDGTLYLTSYNGLYKSTDGGLNFSLMNNYNCNVLLIDPDDHNVLYLGVYYSGLYKSTNAGSSWSKYFDAFDSSLSVTGIVKYKNDGDTIYAANNHNVYKIWQQLVIINNSTSQSPESYVLSQNYPNPFNPSTKISYKLQMPGYISLRIHDVAGREISSLVNTRQSAGSYEIIFPSDNLPSGVYFYSMYIDGIAVASRKMVVLK
ncbi:MAG: hypothetical protein K1X85_04775 [Ignavibacteria bacterium]|nr:hypothetical protein [Ignavibacteria bacterium]